MQGTNGNETPLESISVNIGRNSGAGNRVNTSKYIIIIILSVYHHYYHNYYKIRISIHGHLSQVSY